MNGNACCYSVIPVLYVRPEQGRGRTELFNPDSAVEREVMSKEQTFRSEDNAFCL
jgi:hypothetical protein